MKSCPVCHAMCFDDMEVCYGCLHRFDAPVNGEAAEGPASQTFGSARNDRAREKPATSVETKTAGTPSGTSRAVQPATGPSTATSSHCGQAARPCAAPSASADTRLPIEVTIANSSAEAAQQTFTASQPAETAQQVLAAQQPVEAEAQTLPIEGACIQLVINLRPYSAEAAPAYAQAGSLAPMKGA